MIRRKHNGIRPQDIVVLLKLIVDSDTKYTQLQLAADLAISLSEVSESLERSKFSGLLSDDKQTVNRQALLDIIIYSIQYIFPVKPLGFVKGMPTAHSYTGFESQFLSEQKYVWPHAEGTAIGLEVQPLYPNQAEAAKKDEELYKILAAIDMIRLGRKREQKFGKEMVSTIILGSLV
ncbi:hypothetical protein [Polluticaenibacter yanchengensis]|uniref:Uncharacterized protein n=1 Tax=Polluticaenibacter yanchengensis TaxID=3014562 RepID=A0ABT4UPA4_9BACT|nr:hypothetical protein [Chitinophagaceae bacterium LY-5]